MNNSPDAKKRPGARRQTDHRVAQINHQVEAVAMCDCTRPTVEETVAEEVRIARAAYQDGHRYGEIRGHERGYSEGYLTGFVEGGRSSENQKIGGKLGYEAGYIDGKADREFLDQRHREAA